ncbi:class I SAM-dependent methyltransferase [Streptomyces puniciscabiei]
MSAGIVRRLTALGHELSGPQFGGARRPYTCANCPPVACQWQTPRYDLPGIIGEQLRGVNSCVVDVGCGDGKFIQRLRQDRPDLALLGLDIAPGILAGVPGPVAVADAIRLPLATGSADAALALHLGTGRGPARFSLSARHGVFEVTCLGGILVCRR